MRMIREDRIAAVRAFALFLLTFSLQAAAAPFAVQVGDTRVALDSPPGFTDSSFTGSPRLQELAEQQTSPSNRILMFAIGDGDMRKFMTGDRPEFRRYMLIVTPRPLERERVTPQVFKDLVAKASGEAVAVGNTELRKEEEVFSILQRTVLPPVRRGAQPTAVLATRTLLLLRGKTLDLTVFSAEESPADLDWIRAITTRWIEDLRRLNDR
jgi:hypothetical protein